MNKQILADNKQFKVISFNTESIFSKLDNIKLFLEALKSKNIFFDAICVDECWLVDFAEDLDLEGYTSFPLTRKVGMKGGLITYIDANYRVKDLDLYTDSMSWEGQFLEVSGNNLRSKLLLSNLSREKTRESALSIKLSPVNQTQLTGRIDQSQS